MCKFLSKEESSELNQIIVDLYDNNNYEEALKKFLINIQPLVPYDKGDIYIFNKTGNHINFENYIFVGFGSEANSYVNKYCEQDDVLPLISVTQPLMFRSSEVFLLSERKKTEYYKNHLEPSKMYYSIEGNIYVEEDNHIVGMGLHRSKESEDFTQKELDIIKIMRPHLSKISQKLHDDKLNANMFVDAALVISETDKVGIWILNCQLEFVDENVGHNHFISEHSDELKHILQVMCRSLRNNIESDEKNNKPYGMKSKIMLSEKSYYVDITYKPELDNKESVFVVILYDYTGIIDNIVAEMKQKFSLTEREYDIFLCMVKGMNNQEIQNELFISMPTVKKHLTNIYQKLGVEGRHQVIHSIL